MEITNPNVIAFDLESSEVQKPSENLPKRVPKICETPSYYDALDAVETRCYTSVRHPPIAKTRHSTVHRAYAQL